MAAGRAADTRWAPDPLWEPAYLRRQASEFDIAHVHFGFDDVPPTVLQLWVDVLRETGRPLVLTVHDLRNPHHRSAERLDAQLGVLLPAAAAVLTLTEGARDIIARRWRRDAVVVPHPAVFPAGPAPGVSATPGLVGIHLKSLRANLVDVEGMVRATARAVAAAGGRLQVSAHREVSSRVGALGHPVVLREYLSDEALRVELTRLSVSVMVNRFGTHSGWLEACRDVGTAVVAPDCGYYADQWPAVHTYRHNERAGLDVASLQAAVAAAVSAPSPAPADPAWRRGRDRAGQRTHAAIYHRITG